MSSPNLDPLQQILALSTKQRKLLLDKVARALKKVDKNWRGTAQQIVDLLNRGLDATTQAELRRIIGDALDKQTALLEVLIVAGVADGAAAANRLLTAAGLPKGEAPATVAGEDVINSARDASYRLRDEIIASPDNDTVRKGLARLLLSARAATYAAYANTYHETVEAVTTSANPPDMVWVTAFRPRSKNSSGTCDVCAALHGRVVKPGEVITGYTDVWGAPLVRPPRHPNCGCRLVPVPETPSTTTPATMRSYAAQWTATNITARRNRGRSA